MGHALTSSQAVDAANAMALEKAGLGDGAEVVDVRRKAWNSDDLVYVVQGADGERKEVVVAHAALMRRLSAVGITKK